MSRKKPQKAKLPSWRDLQKKHRSTKTTTKVARKRRLVMVLRGAFALFILIAIVAGIFGIRYFRQVGAKPPLPEPVSVEVEVDFQSNGVLTKEWLETRLGKTLDDDIRGIDVQSVKDQLESEGQVETVMVKVSLPSRLVISLEEREPILRLRVRNSEGIGETLLLARDGILYQGFGYPDETLRRLPGVTGLKLRKSGDGYEQLEGLGSVAYLLDCAKAAIPSVYRHWQVIDLGDWNPELNYRPSLVRIKSSHIEELVFATDGVEDQMERLAGILEHLQRNQMQLPVFIDLSFGSEAVIRYN